MNKQLTYQRHSRRAGLSVHTLYLAHRGEGTGQVRQTNIRNNNSNSARSHIVVKLRVGIVTSWRPLCMSMLVRPSVNTKFDATGMQNDHLLS